MDDHQAGEPVTYEEYVTDDFARLLRLARILQRDPNHAEDLVQDTLLRVGEHWSRARQAPSAYARRTMINLVKDQHRRRLRRPRELSWDDITNPALTPTSGDHADDVVSNTLVMAAFRDLPERQRAVMALKVWHDLSIEQIADLLDCSTGTVKSHTHRATAALRARLGPSVADLLSSATLDRR